MIFSKPELAPLLAGLVPSKQILDPGVLYVGIGILGATVMPHNLYLHSAIVNTRAYDPGPAGKREAIKFATWDSTLALDLRLFHQRLDPDSGGRRLSLCRAHRHCRDSRRLQTALANAGRGGRQRAVCRGAAGFGAKQHPDRHPDRADCDGGLCQHQAQALGAPAGHAPDRHYSHRDRGAALRRERHRPAADFLAGGALVAALVCGGAADDVLRRPGQDGRVCHQRRSGSGWAGVSPP